MNSAATALKSYLLESGTLPEEISKAVSHAKWSKSMLTGESQDEYILKYRTKETKEQKQQRINVYNSRTPFVSQKIYGKYNVVEQADNVYETLELGEGKTAEKARNIIDNIQGIGLKRFFYETFQKLTFYDPNAFLALGSDDYSSIFVIKSSNALKFTKEKGRIKDIIFSMGGTFYSYNGEGWATFTKLEKKKTGTGKLMNLTDGANKGSFDVHFGNYELISECPVWQVGYIEDATTDFKTFASPLKIASPLFDDLIKDKNSYDVAKAVHAFLKKYAFVPECSHTTTVDNRVSKCVDGRMSHDQSKCTKCKGTGMNIHFSEQDVILLKLKKLENATNLANMVHYERIPIDIVQSYKEDYKDVEKDIINMVFQSDLFSKNEVANTATEKILDTQAVNAKFVKYLSKLLEGYRFFTKLIAQSCGVKEPKHTCGFTPDFKIETVGDLLQLRSTALGANVPAHFVQMIDQKLLVKFTNGSKTEVRKVEAKEYWRPFKYRSDADKALILSTLSETDDQYLLYVHFDQIMMKIDEDRMKSDVKFWHHNRAEQRLIIENELKIIKENVINQIRDNQVREAESLLN